MTEQDMCHVLIIEDEPVIAEYIGAVAADAGASTFSFAATEREAIDAAQVEAPRVILSDVRLAQGTGPGAVREIAKSLGPVPVIFITGTPAEIDDCGCPSSVLVKPVEPAVLLSAIKDAVCAR